MFAVFVADSIALDAPYFCQSVTGFREDVRVVARAKNMGVGFPD
jgi:hypothetical protein